MIRTIEKILQCGHPLAWRRRSFLRDHMTGSIVIIFDGRELAHHAGIYLLCGATGTVEEVLQCGHPLAWRRGSFLRDHMTGTIVIIFDGRELAHHPRV